MGFQIYVTPYRDNAIDMWVFDILDDDEELLERFRYKTQDEALQAHRERFISDVCKGQRGKVDE
jgi:hypothetical protein